MTSEPISAPAVKRRHLFAAALGNALEFYDFVVYSFFAIQIGHAFFPAHDRFTSLMLSLATFGAGFITRPVGAFVIGAYADRAGRRPAMMLCFVLMGLAIVGMAIIPTYARIGAIAPALAVLCRMLQGFSVGGEVGSNTAYLMEAAPPHRRGLITSWQGGSQAISSMLGALVGLALATVMAPDMLDAYGWRIAFLLGAVTVPFGLMLRRTMPETLHAQETHAAPEVHSGPRRGGPIPLVIWIGLAILGSQTIATYTINYMTTYAQNSLHMGPQLSFAAGLVPNLVNLPAVLFGGWLSDKIGRRPLMIWPMLARVIVMLPLFYLIVTWPSAATLLGGMAVLGGLSGLISGGFYAALTESLPKAKRGQHFALTYSIAIMVFGGTTQPIITWLIEATGKPIAPGVYLVVTSLIALFAMLAMRETAPVRNPAPMLELAPA